MSKKQARVRLRSEMYDNSRGVLTKGKTTVEVRVAMPDDRSSAQVFALLEQAVAEIRVQLGLSR